MEYVAPAPTQAVDRPLPTRDDAAEARDDRGSREADAAG